MEKLRRELEAAVEALEQGRQELSSFAEQVFTLHQHDNDDGENYEDDEIVDE